MINFIKIKIFLDIDSITILNDSRLNKQEIKYLLRNEIYIDVTITYNCY